MNKAELIQYLKICQEKVDELDDAISRYEGAKKGLYNLNQQPKSEKDNSIGFSSNAMWGVFGIVYLPLVLLAIIISNKKYGMLDYPISFPFNFDNSAFGLFLGDHPYSFPFILGIVFGVFAGRFWGKRKKAKRQAEVESKNKITLYNWENQKATNTRDLQQKIDRYRWEIQRIQKELAPYAAQCGLHQRYQNRMALNFIIDYLETGRSDTLKEALNLHESTMRELNRIDREYENQRRLEQITREGLADVQDELARNTEAVNRNTVSTDAAGLMGAMAYEELRHIRKNQ